MWFKLFLIVGRVVPQEAHQVPKGPPESEGKLGGHRNVWVRHRNFIVWVKYFKFKTESKFIFFPASSAAQKANLYFAVFPTPYPVESILIWWLFCCPKYVTALMLWREMISACSWLHCNRTSLASFHQSKETRWLWCHLWTEFLKCLNKQGLIHKTKYLKQYSVVNKSNINIF